MNLEDFVASSLAQISAGIRKAQEQAAGSGAWINPAGQIQGHKERTPIEIDVGAHVYLENVDFDVAVSAATDQSADAGGGIRVLGLQLGAEGAVKYENSSISRVRFSVPVVWPYERKSDLEEKRKRAQDEANAQFRAAQRNAPRYT